MKIIMIRDAYFNWFEDECFYSLCSRQHGFWANGSSRETLASLFDVGIKSYSHDFPTYLDKLNPSAVAVWGNSENIINRHTIAPLFFPFQSAEHVHAHKEAMKGNCLGSIKYKLGLITGRFGSEHPLKACSACILDDKRKHSVAYWHLSHQFPGVTICPAHDHLLRESRINRQWSREFCLELPSEKNLISPEKFALSDNAFEALKGLSHEAVKLAGLGASIELQSHLVSRVYHAAMADLGAPWQDKTAAAVDFTRHCLKLREHPLFSPLPSSNECATAFVTQMTRKPRGHCHPLKHLTFISWLFGGVDAFVKAYQNQAVADEAKEVAGIKSADLSQGKTSNEVKTSIPSLIFKPKKVFKEIKESVTAALESGLSKDKTCESFGISISTINRILRLSPEVGKKIAATARINMNSQRREEWCAAVFEHPELSVKRIRQLIPGTYAWLYRNDMTWLKTQCCKLPCGRYGNNSAINWDDRDKKLCARIMATIIEYDTAAATTRKCDIYELVPGLYSALERKSHYAKTRKLLAELKKPGPGANFRSVLCIRAKDN